MPDEAESRFGRNNEIDFWRHHSRFVALGENPSPEVGDGIARSGSSLVPHFYLFVPT